MWFKIIVACVPAAVVELVWGDQLEAAFYHSSSGCINVDIGWYRVFDRRTLEQGT